MTQTNQTGGRLSFVATFAFFQPAGRNKSRSTFREVVISTNNHLVVLAVTLFHAVFFSFEAVSVRQTRHYVTHTVAASYSNFSTFVFLSVSYVSFKAFVLTGNRNQYVVSIVTTYQTVYLVVFVNARTQSGVAVEQFQMFCIQRFTFCESTSVATEETRIFIVQTQVERVTGFIVMNMFVARISIVTWLVLSACAETSEYWRVVTYRYFTLVNTFQFAELQN